MKKDQFRLSIWTGLFSVVLAGLSVAIGDQAVGIAAVLSVVVVAIVLISRGFSSQIPQTTPAEYFGASSMMATTTTLQSLGSEWIMLGNVIVAGMILGQVFGLIAFWVVATWSLAFVLMSHRVDRIRSVLGPEDTLHTFLHRVYGSIAMRQTAGFVTIFVGFGVFCTELIAGMALLISVLPAPQAAVLAPLLILLLVVAMCVAAIAGGLRSIITTDAMLWPIIIAGVAMMALFALQQGTAQPIHANLSKLVPEGLNPAGIVAFLVGIAALQVPLLLGDFGTWQRIKATQQADSKSLAAHTLRQAAWQAFLWGIPVLAGIAVLGLPASYEVESGNLYASSSPLIEMIRHWLNATNVVMPVKVAIVSVFLVGMLSVMVSTANSYLLIAMETWVRDLSPRSLDEGYPDENSIGKEAVSRAKIICILIGLVACLPIILLVSLNVNLVSIIVVVFSVQVALSPATVLALYFPDFAAKSSRVVVSATIGGFVAALVYGCYTSYFVVGWWRDYGSFLTAVVALGLPMVAIVINLALRGQGLPIAGVFLTKLLWPWK